jgi:hypothetical protein
VRSVSASTNESDQSSLTPAGPYRDRGLFTCRELITTTTKPAASNDSTSTPSLRSIATSQAPFSRSRPVSISMPALS